MYLSLTYFEVHSFEQMTEHKICYKFITLIERFWFFSCFQLFTGTLVHDCQEKKNKPRGHLLEHRNAGFIQGTFLQNTQTAPLSVAKYLRVLSLGTFYDLKTATPTIPQNKCKEFVSAHRSSSLSTLTSKNYNTAVVFLPSFLLCAFIL